MLRDPNEKRVNYMAMELAETLGPLLPEGCVIGPYAPAVDRIAEQYIRHIRLMLPRDRQLTSRKDAVAQSVAAFEKERKYNGHIALDVDPA